MSSMHANGTIPSSSTDQDVQQLWARYKQTKQAEQTKDALIEDLLNRYDQLSRSHRQYIQDHQHEQPSVDTVAYWSGQALHMQNLLNRSAFVVALIDGDSLLFNECFLRQGAIGGQQVATLLQSAIARAIPKIVPDCPADFITIVRVFADFKWLGAICAQSGLISAPNQLVEFAQGFLRSNMSFDFVDVGPGQDVAFAKVADAFKFYLGDYTCRQVLLGCGEEQSKPLVAQYHNDQEARPRFTLLEGVPFADPYPQVSTVEFPGIFRTSKIILPLGSDGGRARVDSRVGLNGASGIFTPSRSATPASSRSPLRSITNLAVRPPSQAADSRDQPTTWATVTTKNAHKPLTNASRSSIASEPKDGVLRNKKNQRVDQPMDYDRDEVARVKKLKACNQHYIGFGCCHYNAGKADKCPHHHHYTMSALDLKYLRVVARETPCKRGHECDDVKCIYGHQCPFPPATEGSIRGIGCLNGDQCRFPRSMHNMDTAPVKMIRVVGAF